jgi:hypothetical protein
MSVPDIMAKVKARFGNMQQDTKLNLKERMLTMLKTTDGLDTHISDLQDMFDVSETAGFPIDRNRQVEIFRETVCGHPMITKVFDDFDHDFPDGKTVSFDQIVAYLILHLPHVKHAQMAATRANANFVAATAYTTLEAESKRLKAEVENLKRKNNPTKTKNNKKKNKKQLGLRTQTPDTSDTAALKYCHGHGYQKSHTSAECKVLAGDKKKFTAAMRNAKGPKNPPGGSTKINGQAVPTTPKTVTANMAHQLEEEQQSEQMSDSDYDDETATFLAGVLNDSMHEEDLTGYLPPDHVTTQAVAMMMDDDLLLDDNAKPARRSFAATTPYELPSNQELRTMEGSSSMSGAVENRDIVPTSHLLITNGSQLQIAFWERERRSLQRLMDKQQKAAKLYFAPVPSPEELQMQFIKWIGARPDLPPLISPASSGFYDDMYGGMQPQYMNYPRQSGTGFFDEEYVGGQRTEATVVRSRTPGRSRSLEFGGSGPEKGASRLEHSTGSKEDVQGKESGLGLAWRPTGPGGRPNQVLPAGVRLLNPFARKDFTYHEVCTAELTSTGEIDRQEERIYQPGYTPNAIRNNITKTLRESDPNHHLIDFQEKDIPPLERDPYTHRVLSGLLAQRNQLDQCQDCPLPLHSVAVDGTSLEKNTSYEQERIQRDIDYNRLNRQLYQAYAASPLIIHDRNFLAYCRPSLRNLPVITAFKLTKLRDKLRDSLTNTELPPYTMIERSASAPTVPVFTSNKPSYADVVRIPLKPRAQWMKEQPPLMSDAEADETWHQACGREFGNNSNTHALQQQMDMLKQQLNDRQQQMVRLERQLEERQAETQANQKLATSNRQRMDAVMSKMEEHQRTNHPPDEFLDEPEETEEQQDLYRKLFEAREDKYESANILQPRNDTSPPQRQHLATRTFRQGIKTDTAEYKINNSVNLSKSRNQDFLRSDVQNKDKQPISQKMKELDQLESSEKMAVPDNSTDNVKEKSSSGQITAPFRNPTRGQDEQRDSFEG